MSIAHVEIYTERGVQLSRARIFMESDEAFCSALALVAVHSGIAFNDALLARFDRSALGNEDHTKAVELTDEECKRRRLDREGLSQLRKLLKAKTKVSYGPERVTQETSKALSIAAARFEAWFHKTMEAIE